MSRYVCALSGPPNGRRLGEWLLYVPVIAPSHQPLTPAPSDVTMGPQGFSVFREPIRAHPSTIWV